MLLFFAVALFLSERVFAEPTCFQCGDSCSLVPPDSASGFPCYQGTPSDAVKCFETDPLLKNGTTWTCDTCSSLGFPEYLRNDPIYKNMQLWSHSSVKSTSVVGAGTVCDGCTSSCSLVPPASAAGFPCYQGSPADATKCYNTDPLLQEGTTWTCSTCQSLGYTTYLQNDPIYKSMELWSATSAKSVVQESVASAASGTSCSCTQYGGGTCSGFCSGSSCPCMNCQTWTQKC